MITTETCSYCKGRKLAQRIEEKRDNGWFPNSMIGFDLAEAWIKSDPLSPIRIVDCECPQCSGRGEYEVEHFTCKIF